MKTKSLKQIEKKDEKNYLENLAKECKKYIECDTARISKPLDTMYLIIGFNRNTKDNEGVWMKNGHRIDFDYVDETIVATGKTKKELIQSIEAYKQLCNITWEEYFQELKKSKKLI